MSPMSAISISASKDDPSRFDVVEQRTDAYRAENQLECESDFVWVHHRIRLNWMSARAVTKTTVVQNRAL
jgi:hypothetical protein